MASQQNSGKTPEKGTNKTIIAFNLYLCFHVVIFR